MFEPRATRWRDALGIDLSYAQRVMSSILIDRVCLVALDESVTELSNAVPIGHHLARYCESVGGLAIGRTLKGNKAQEG
jgi:hypothetical protein